MIKKKGRESLCTDLRGLSSNLVLCIILRDFNALMKLDERVGQLVMDNEVEDMKRCMHDCKLLELKTSGQYYTWSNKQEGNSKVLCKLNRALGNDAWFNEWPTTEVFVTPEGEYDHYPLIINSFPDVNIEGNHFDFLICRVKLLSS